MIHQEQSEENEALNGGGAQFNFASLLQEQEKKDEERRQKMAAVHIQDYMQLDDKITTGDLHNHISEIRRDHLTDTNKHLMVGNRRDQVLNKQNLFNPGLSIGSPDDEVNLKSESLAFIMSNHKLKRHPHGNSIENDLMALH